MLIFRTEARWIGSFKSLTRGVDSGADEGGGAGVDPKSTLAIWAPSDPALIYKFVTDS
jgi:hypothetical protein